MKENTETIMVNRKDMLKALIANRAEHGAAKSDEIREYQKDLQDQLDKYMAAVKGGKHPAGGAGSCVLSTAKRVPVLYLDLYDKAIKRMELDVREEVPITERQFNAFMFDEWYGPVRDECC